MKRLKMFLMSFAFAIVGVAFQAAAQNLTGDLAAFKTLLSDFTTEVNAAPTADAMETVVENYKGKILEYKANTTSMTKPQREALTAEYVKAVEAMMAAPMREAGIDINSPEMREQINPYLEAVRDQIRDTTYASKTLGDYASKIVEVF